MEDLLELEADPIEGEEPLEQPAEGADLAEQTEETEGEEEQQEVTSLFGPDNKVAKPIRDTLAKLKTENPSIAKIITDAVYRTAELRREFPGGLTEARELRDKVEQYGGVTGIEEKVASAQTFTELATAFTNADPAFVQDLVESDPEAFAKVAPQVFDRFREVNADGFNAYVGKIVYGDIQSKDIPLYLMRLGDLIKDKPEAVTLLATVNNYLAGFKTLAEKAPTSTPIVKAKQAPANNESQRENELRSREWNADRKELQTSIKGDSFTKALAGRKPSTEEKAQIEELFNSRAVRLADNLFKDWRKVSQGYITRNDKRGYLRYMESIYRRIVPEAMTSAVSSTMKGARAAAIKRPSANGQQPMKAAEGFSPIAKEPETHDIDYSQTNSAMISQNRAVLRSGKKVQWR